MDVTDFQDKNCRELACKKCVRWPKWCILLWGGILLGCLADGKFALAAGDPTPPTLAQIWPTNQAVHISDLCHGLLFYGLGPADLPFYPSGDSMLKALTDEPTAIKIFGKSPFVRTRNGLRYFLANDPVFGSLIGEAHRDQCLATFATLNLPLNTGIHLNFADYSISNLLAESIANFSFDQHEPAWTAMAYAKYLPPQKQWINRFNEQTSFSQLAQFLLKVDPKTQSCAGTHIFQALVAVDNADRRFSILDNETRKQLDSYLIRTVKEAVLRQQADGGWDHQWCDTVQKNDAKTTDVQNYDRLLVTGHLLEVLNSLDSERRPPNMVYLHAAEWVMQSLHSLVIPTNAAMVCPFTHAARSARAIMAYNIKR